MKAQHLNRLISAAVTAIYVVTAAVALKPTPAQAIAIPTPATAAFYGDSITYESSWQINYLMSKKKGWAYSVTAYPGYALCDWMGEMEAKIATRPSIVILETQGNSVTNCMKDANGVNYPYGSTGWLNKYRSDLDHVLATANLYGVKMLLVLPLPFADSTATVGATSLLNMEKTEAAKYHNISITAAPRNSVTNSGKYTWMKPCLATETAATGCDQVSKLIYVRAPDGLHLCPAIPGQYNFLTGCPVYSSGEFRYGKALVAAAVSPPAPLLP